MPRVLPSNFAANRRAVESSRAFVRGSLNLGTKAFGAMFPTMGKLLGGISSKPEQDKIRTNTRRALESVDDGLVRNNASLSEVLNNQNIQNNLLTQLLNLYKSTPGGTAPILPIAPGPELPDIITVPRNRPSAATRPSAQPSRPTVPATRPSASATPAARPAAPPASAAVRSIGNSALRFAGRIAAVSAFYLGTRDLGNNTIRVPTNVRQTFNRTLNSFKENLDYANSVYQSLQNETDPNKARELEADLTRTLDNMKSQRARLIDAARELDAAIAAEIERQRRRGNVINRPNYMERVLALPETDFEASSSPEPATPPPPPVVPPPPPPPSDNAAAVPPPPPEVATPVATPPIVSPPTTTETTTTTATPLVVETEMQKLLANNNYEKISFEADKIKFDGPTNLQQTASVVTQPSVVSSGGGTEHNRASHGGSMGGAAAGTQTTSSGAGGTSGASSSTISVSSSGGPMATQVGASAPTGSSPPPVTGTTAQILATIRQKESGSNYQAQSRSSTASGAYQFINSTWQSLTRQFNIGTEYSRAVDAPPAIQDAVAGAYVNQILSRNNNDVSVVPLVWYTGNAQGRMSEAALAANRGLTPQRYQTEWMQLFASMGGSVPSNAAQTQVASAPSTGPALTQASTQRVVVDRQQISANQRLTAELQQQVSRTPERQNTGSATAEPRRSGEKPAGEVPLKIRILSAFEQLTRT